MAAWANHVVVKGKHKHSGAWAHVRIHVQMDKSVQLSQLTFTHNMHGLLHTRLSHIDGESSGGPRAAACFLQLSADATSRYLAATILFYISMDFCCPERMQEANSIFNWSQTRVKWRNPIWSIASLAWHGRAVARLSDFPPSVHVSVCVCVCWEMQTACSAYLRDRECTHVITPIPPGLIDVDLKAQLLIYVWTDFLL